MPNKGKPFCEKLERAIQRDHKGVLVKLVQDHPDEEVAVTPLYLIDKCAEFGARKCLLALLQGQVCGPPPQLDTAVSVNTLAVVAHTLPDDPQIINLLLTRCGAVPLANVSCTIGLVHGAPLHFVLVYLSFMEHLFPWSRGHSLIDLVVLLCQWKTKSVLDSARLLAQYTDSINHIAWMFVKNGGLKQLGALLLVAREKVMAPFESGLTIHEYITREISSVSEGDIRDEQSEYKNMLIDSRQLLDVFERAGDALSYHCTSMQKYVPVEKVSADVSGLLMKAQVHVSTYDLNLHYYGCYPGFRGLSRSNLTKGSGTCEADKQKCLYAVPAGGVRSGNFYTGSGHLGLRRPQPMSVPKIVSPGFQPRLYNTARQVKTFKTMSKSVEHVGVNPLANCLVHLCMKLKNGLRLM